MIDTVRLYVPRSRSARRLHGVGSWMSRVDWYINYAVRGWFGPQGVPGSRKENDGKIKRDSSLPDLRS
jgi:hypothetical protein